jgi:hypothetical protein
LAQFCVHAELPDLSTRFASAVGSDEVTEPADRWSRWLLHDRFGGDARALQRTMEFLEGNQWTFAQALPLMP